MQVNVAMAVFSESSNDELEAALIYLSQGDCDWNGENGPGYTRKEVIEAGYESNAAYYANKLKCLEWQKAVAQYLDTWLAHDNYYEGYSWTYIEDSGNIFVSLAYATEG